MGAHLKRQVHHSGSLHSDDPESRPHRPHLERSLVFAAMAKGLYVHVASLSQENPYLGKFN